MKSVIGRKIWIVILITILCTSITSYISIYKIRPIYKADITEYVVSKHNSTDTNTLTYNDIMVNKEMIKDFPDLLISKKVTSGVIKKMGINNMSSGELEGKLSIKISNDSNVFVISVKDNDPERAKDIANAVGEVFVSTVSELTNQNNIKILDNADLPTYQQNKNRYNNIILSFIVSMFGSSAAILLTEYKDNTIKTVEQVQIKLGYKVIGIIPEMNIK